MARRTSAPERLVKWARRRPSRAALVAVSAFAVVAAVAGLAIGFFAVAAEKTRADRTLDQLKAALGNERSALRRMRENSYYQTIALAVPEILSHNIGRADDLLDSCPQELRRWEWGALKRLAHGESRSWDFPTELAALAFSRDGHLLAAAGGALAEPGTVALWDPDSGRLIQSFRAHTDAINGLAFDPDGPRLATAACDRTVRIWDARSGRPLRTLQGHRSAVSCVAYSPDGRLVASAGADRMIKLWDAEHGSERRHALRPYREHLCNRLQSRGLALGLGRLRGHDQALGSGGRHGGSEPPRAYGTGARRRVQPRWAAHRLGRL